MYELYGHDPIENKKHCGDSHPNKHHEYPFQGNILFFLPLGVFAYSLFLAGPLLTFAPGRGPRPFLIWFPQQCKWTPLFQKPNVEFPQPRHVVFITIRRRCRMSYLIPHPSHTLQSAIILIPQRHRRTAVERIPFHLRDVLTDPALTWKHIASNIVHSFILIKQSLFGF